MESLEPQWLREKELPDNLTPIPCSSRFRRKRMGRKGFSPYRNSVRGEDFAETLDFAVVGINGKSGLLQMLGELLCMLTGDLADIHPGIGYKADFS